MMRKFLFALGAVFTIGLSGVADAKVGPENVGSGLDIINYVIPSFVVTGATDDTVGRDGVIVHYNVTTADVNFAWTSSIAVLPYPAKLYIDVQDDTADSIPSCAVTIRGKNQFGKSISESFTAVVEGTNQLSTNVFESVASFSGSCGADRDANDDVRVVMSGFVGLPIDIRRVGQVVSVTHTDDTNTWHHGGAAADRAPGVSSGQFDNAGASSRINLRYNWFDLETAGTMIEPLGEDTVSIRINTQTSR